MKELIEKDAVLAAIEAENSQVTDQSLSNLPVVTHIQQQQQTPEQVCTHRNLLKYVDLIKKWRTENEYLIGMCF